MRSGGKPWNLKQNNTRAVLDLMRRGGIFSVAEISESVQLSKTTVKKIFDTLVDKGLLLSAGKGDSTDEGGKKPELFRFNVEYGYAISIHVTPDAIVAVTTDLTASITYLRNTDLSRELGIEAVMRRLAELVRSFTALKASSGQILLGIVVILPGLVDPQRGVSIYSPHYPEWGRELAFTEILEARLAETLGERPSAPIFIDNANRIQAIAEREKGVAVGCDDFVVIDALREGLGAGFIVQGEVALGHQSLSGEIGHMTLDPREGFPCICGNRGCFEAMVSAKRIVGLAREAQSLHPDSVLFSGSESFGLAEICEGAANGDELCLGLVDEAADWFIVGLGNIIMTNDPELIVIQGEYVKAGGHFIERLREGIRHIGLPDVEKKVRIEYSTMGEERGVIGGAAAVIDNYFSGLIIG